MNNYIINIESSTSICGISLANNGITIAEINVYEKNYHDKVLAQNIDFLLKSFNLKTSDLSAVAVSSGPGSFTGLRVGGSIAKAICFGRDINIIPISIFELFFETLKEKSNIENFDLLLHSHSDFYYFLTSNDINHLNKITLINQSELVFKNPIFGIFDENKINGKSIEIDMKIFAKLSFEKFQKNLIVNPNEFSPNYYQDFKVKTKI